MSCFISSFHTKSETQCVFYTFSTSQFKLALFQVVHSRTWTIFDVSDRSCPWWGDSQPCSVNTSPASSGHRGGRVLPAPPGTGLDMRQSQTSQVSPTPLQGLTRFPDGAHNNSPQVAPNSCSSTGPSAGAGQEPPKSACPPWAALTLLLQRGGSLVHAGRGTDGVWPLLRVPHQHIRPRKAPVPWG